jgi:Tfp pilus assembly protein PilF/predicted RNA-binding Zn-ribbon protein involved in translation (DUF1610 family)
MNNFCSECGYKLESHHKFCPNCGAEVIAKTDDKHHDEKSASEKIIVCENCGEDNQVTNETCFSCGVKLKGSVVKKEIDSSSSKRKETGRPKVEKKVPKENTSDHKSKELDGKKLFLISSVIIVVIVVLLISTGVFDSQIDQTQQQVNNQSDGSGIDLSNLDMITDLENKVNANPDDKASTIQLANLLQDSGLYEKAIGYYKKYLEMEPGDANALVDMGICHYNLGDYQIAITEMENAIKFQPKHQLAHLNLGIVNLTAGNLDVSKEWFRKALEIDPNSQAGKRAQELLESH